MNARNKFLILLGIILAITATYYFFSTPRGSDLVLVGTVDANQIVVSPQIRDEFRSCWSMKERR